ncbi:MAG: ThuA domain-containing protein [Actinobacteria bacterium]|nr:MAG: ThuA domain-containing protein [Actinomycetota bacterium]
MKRAATLLVVISIALTSCSHAAKPSATVSTRSLPSILVFTRTRGFHHSSIPAAIAAIKQLGQRNGFAVDASADPSLFTDARLARYRAVAFLLTTGDVLDDEQQAVFQRYIEHGGGFVGVHSASDTEYGWPWYGELVGAFFKNHPKIQRATVLVRDRTLAATAALPERWVRTDEWYNFRTDPTPHVHVLLTVDEATYTGGTMGAAHPIAWCHDFDGGRAWYTAMGHASSAYSEPMFLSHLLRGILYASKLESTGCPPPQV